MTVYLDGASPSESDGEQMPKKTPVKVAKKMSLEEENTEDLHITLSPDKMSRGIMSDSSDTEDELRPLTTPPASRCLVACQPLCSFNDSPSGSSDEDIFDLDYSVCNTHALRKAYKEIKSAEASRTPPPLPFHGSTSTSSKPVVSFDSDEDCVIEECSVESKKRDNSDDIVISPPSPVLFDIEGSEQANQYAKTKKSKKKKSKSQQDEFINKEGMSVNDSLSTSTDIMDTDDEEDEVNPEMQVLIKWSSERFRLPIRKWQPFSHLYEALGKKYKVSADRVVLNLQDKIINPSHCPGDLKLTIADCIEGGIQSKQSSSRNQVAGVLAVSKDPNSILLRVQSADKKAAVTISLGLNEMMSVLMHKYAEEKQLSLDKLQFFFDGDMLNSRSTPYSLDMEDGECIDVYMLS